MLETGLTYTSVTEVTPDMTAEAVGSGDLPVLGTPMMMALMENAAMNAVASAIEDVETTVGGHIESSHLAPSPVNHTVRATATLVKIEGRKLYFEIEAYDGETLIGRGTHLRFIVNRDKFIARL